MNDRLTLVFSSNRSLLCWYRENLKWLPTHSFLVWIWNQLQSLKDRLSVYAGLMPKSDLTKIFIPCTHYLQKLGIQRTVLLKKGSVVTPSPQIFPKDIPAYIVSPHARYTYPECYLAEMSNVCARGGTSVIFHGNHAVHHDLYIPGRDYTWEEMHGIYKITAGDFSKVIHASLHTPARISTAAAFMDSSSYNYAHWLTEILPRIMLFCQQAKYKDIPLLLDEWLHPNMKSAIQSICGNNREIHYIPLNKAVNIDKLYLVSAASYIPFEPRDKSALQSCQGVFHRAALQNMREKLLSKIASDSQKKNDYPKRIFLRRRANGARSLINEHEVESRLADYGFASIFPETLNFLDQVALFHQADTIVGSAGSAFSNLIFCKPRATILIFMPQHASVAYWFWQNLACASGNRISYLLSQYPSTSGHDHISVNLSEMDHALCTLGITAPSGFITS